jgi:AraC-like DNA-binding protein
MMAKVHTSQALSDPLSDIATRSGLTCTSVERWNLKPPFAIRYAGSDHAIVHAVVRGEVVIVGLRDEPVRVGEGGTAVLPHDVPHIVASSWPLSEDHVVDAPAEAIALGDVRNFEQGHPQADTIVVTMPFAVPGRTPAEPTTEHEEAPAPRPQIKVLGVPGEDILEMLVLIAKLSIMPGLGDRYVATRLAEAVLAKVLQRLAGAQSDTLGLFGLFASVGVKTALDAVESVVGRAWTVGELAEIARMPRAAFKAEFQDTVGTSVRDFIDLRRVAGARARIAQGLVSMADAAAAVGFRSRSALTAAVRRLRTG